MLWRVNSMPMRLAYWCRMPPLASAVDPVHTPSRSTITTRPARSCGPHLPRAFTGPVLRCLQGMRHDLDEGALVLADISGFTEFVTATEIEHGPPLIAALLETVIGQISPPLEIQEVEGDAVFALGPDGALGSRQSLLDVLESAFAAFRHRRQELAADESCGCAACRSVGSLDLKIVVHHGRFLRQEVGGRSQVAGTDVILTHRLLKNDVAGRAYLLLTERALRWAELDPAHAGLRTHVQRYEHLGDVRCFVKDLGVPEPAVAWPGVARAA
jgi:hypothetical protein